MTIEKIIAKGVVEAVKDLYGADAAENQAMPSATKKEFEGDLTVIVFPFTKASHKDPATTGKEIG